jgi:transcriptional regulator with XRE-family HTH domain
MTLPEKLEILIKRKGVTKTGIAEMAGITYRALSNYISGGRNPRPKILAKLAGILDTTPEFLTNDSQRIVLSSSERFAFNADSPETAVKVGLTLLDDARKLFSGYSAKLTDNDKQALFACISEVYFNAKVNNKD